MTYRERKVQRRKLCDIDRNIFQLEEVIHRCEERILRRRERKERIWNVAFDADDYEKFSRCMRKAERLIKQDEREYAIIHAAQRRISELQDHLLLTIKLQNAESKL